MNIMGEIKSTGGAERLIDVLRIFEGSDSMTQGKTLWDDHVYNLRNEGVSIYGNQGGLSIRRGGGPAQFGFGIARRKR
jgi:hypothetical protein